MPKNMSFLEKERLRRAQEQLAIQQATPEQTANNLAYSNALKAYIGTKTSPYAGQDNAVGDIFAYAAQGDKQRSALANSLMTGAGLKLKRGDVKNWDPDAAREAIIANESYMQALRNMGMYDTPENAVNAQLVSMVSGDYLKNQLAAINEKLAGSRKADQQHANWQKWSDLQNRIGEMNEYNAPHFWAYADWLMGDQKEEWSFDRYNAAWDMLDDEAFTLEQERLRKQFESIDLPALAKQDSAYESMTGAYEEQLKTVQGEIDKRAKIAELEALARSNPQFEQLSRYEYGGTIPGYKYGFYVPGAEWLQDEMMAFGKDLTNQQTFVNVRANRKEEDKAVSFFEQAEQYRNRGYGYLTPDEISVYNVLYNTDPAKAQEYLDALQSDLYRRMANVERMEQTVYAQNGGWAVPMWLGSVGAGLETAFMAPIQVAAAAMGVDDPNAPEFYFNRAQQNIRGAQEEVLGELNAPEILGKNLYQWGYGGASSAADNTARLMFGGAGSLAAAGLQSASSSLYENAGRDDMEGSAKIVQALLTGGIEVGTEKIGLDALFDMGQDSAVKYLVKAIGSELGEESANYFGEYGVELAVAWLFGHEAEIRSAEELAMGYGETVLNTLISSGIMSGPGTFETSKNVRGAGKNARLNGDINKLVEIGLNMPEDSKSGKIARELETKQKKGKAYSNYDLGRLTMAIEEDTSAELAQAPNKAMDEVIAERMMELGMDEKTAQYNAPLVRKISRGQKLTAEEKKNFRYSEVTDQVAMEYARGMNEQETGAAIQPWMGELEGRTFSAVEAATDKIRAAGEATGKFKKQPQMKAANKADASSSEKAIKAAVEKSAAKVKVNKGSKVPLPTAVSVTVDEGGKKTAGDVTRFVEQDGEVKVEVTTEAGKHTVELGQLTEAEGSGIAAIAAWVEDSNNNAEGTHQMSAQEASTMLQVYQTEGGDAANFIQGFEDAYLAGYSGIGLQKGAKISERAAQIAYEQGRAEAETDEKNRVKRASLARKNTKGGVSWLGTVESNSQVRGAGDAEALEGAMETMTESQRATTEMVKAFAQKFRINAVLFESAEESISQMQNGSFDQATNTIYVDVNAGAYTAEDLKTMRENGTLGYAMLKTLTHEVTHYLEANSPAAYAKYKEAVKREIRRAGKEDWAVLVREKIDIARADGRKMTYGEAEAEVVADASEYMLQNSKFVDGMEDSIKGKVKKIVQNFMDKLNEVFRNLTGGSRESRALRQQINGVYKYTGNLQQLWDAAMDEVLGENSMSAAVEDGPIAQELPDAERIQHTKTTAELAADATQVNDTQENTVQVTADRKNALAANEYDAMAYQDDTEANADNSDAEVEDTALDGPKAQELSFVERLQKTKREAFAQAEEEIAGSKGRDSYLQKQIMREKAEQAAYREAMAAEASATDQSQDAEPMKPAKKRGLFGNKQYSASAYDTSETIANTTQEEANENAMTDESPVANELPPSKRNRQYSSWTGEETSAELLNQYIKVSTQLNEARDRRMRAWDEMEKTGELKAVYDLMEKDAKAGAKAYKELQEKYGLNNLNIDELQKQANELGRKWDEQFTREAEPLKPAKKRGLFGKKQFSARAYDTSETIANTTQEEANENAMTDEGPVANELPPSKRNRQYSTRTPEDTLSIREYLGEMKPTARMNETEKILLKRYQEQLKILREKEQLVAEQDEIIRTAPADSEELTKAKNRRNIYRAQANRAARALAEAERNDGFARLMATSQEVVNRYVLGSAGNVADAADALDAEVEGLTKQLKTVEADVTRTASAQRTAFARGLIDQQTLNRAAQKLKDTYGSRMAAKTIADRLALVYGEIYADNGAEGAKRFAEAARDLAGDILAGHKYRYKSEVLPMLQEKIGTISLTETDLQEIKNAGMTLSEYKRALSPWVKVAEGASDLSSFASNAAYYGDGALAAILGEETEGNLAMNLYNTIQQERTQEQEIGVEGMSEGQMVTAVMADIAGSDMPLSTNSKTVDYLRTELKKFAGESAEAAQNIEQAIMNARKATGKASDVWRAAVKEVETAKQAVEYYRKLEEQRRLTELKELKQTITEELKSENAKKLQEKVKAQREEYRTREQKAREYRKTRDAVDKLRRKIGRDVKRLNTLRVRETDQKHVPQEMQHVADAVMRTFTDSALSRLAFSAEKTASLQRTYQILAELESDYAYYWDDEIKADMDNLVSLSEAYNAIRNREGNVPSYLSLEGVELEMEILQGVDNIVSNVLHMIDTANRNFLEGRQETFEAYANKTGEKLVKHKDAKVLKGAAGKIQTMIDETLRTGNVTPVYFFEHLQNDEIRQVFDQVRKGQSDYAKIVAEGKAFVEETKSKYNYGAWVADGKLKMKTGKGHDIELTREEAAEIYAVYKREQANKLYRTVHLLEGGFQYRNIAEKGAGAYRETDKPHQLDAADMAKISAWLTDEQKAYADELVGYLSTTMADYGNAASMDMYGYKKFTESYYIPFKTVADQRFQRGDEGPQGENAGTGRVKNAGFTKKLQSKADQSLVIGGITDTVADHIHKMAAYSAMVQPIEDMKRLLNHKVMEEDGTVNTIRALIGQKYGKATENYLTQLLKDLNGATQSDTRASGLYNYLVGAFKRGAVLASASVVLQQPTAMARAMAYISPKYFVQNPFYRPSKGTWEEMMKHSGTAVIKDMGKFDVGMGLTATQYIAKAGKAAYDRFMERLTAAPGIADQWTWGIIWKAVKAEQAAMHPDMDVNSEDFLDMCGERFDDVVDHTQVYDSVITRSNLMRSRNQLHKMATSFMSEPTLSLNMLYDAFVGKHSKRQRGAIIGGVVASQVLAGAMAALAQAWNDDDDKRNWLEKYADRAVSNIFDNLNPLGMIPYVSDIVSMFQGYDVERPDMTVIADLMDYTKTFMKAFEDGGAPSWKQIENFAGTWANLLGLPLKNISREVRRLRNAVMSTDWSEPNMTNVGFVAAENVSIFGIYNPWGGEKKDYYDRMITAMQKGDTDLVEDYRTYLTDSKMVVPDKLVEDLRNTYKERYLEGGIEKQTAIGFLLDNGLAKDRKKAFEYVEKWDEGSKNYSPFNDVYAAVKSNNASSITSSIRELVANGYDESEIVSEVRSRIRKGYMEGELTHDQVKSAYKSHFKPEKFDVDDPNDWYWLFKELDWGMAHGKSTKGYSEYEDLYKAVDAGGSGLNKAIKEYQQHGKTRESISSAITNYYKPLLIEAKKSGRGFADLQAKVLTAYQVLGYDRQQKLKTIQKWLEEAQ